MFCSKCGKQIKPEAAFCPYCGKTVKKAAPQENQEKKEINSIAEIPSSVSEIEDLKGGITVKLPSRKTVGIALSIIAAAMLIVAFAQLLNPSHIEDVKVRKEYIEKQPELGSDSISRAINDGRDWIIEYKTKSINKARIKATVFFAVGAPSAAGAYYCLKKKKN